MARVELNLAAGTVVVEAETAEVLALLDRVEIFLPRLQAASYPDAIVVDAPPEPRDEEGSAASDSPKDASRATGAGRRARTSKGTKVKPLQEVDLGLDSDQLVEMTNDYRLRGPRTQNDQVVVLANWLKSKGNVPKFTDEGIFTALRSVGARIPRNLTAVLGNVLREGNFRRVGKGEYEITHLGEERARELPLAKTE